MPEPLDLEPIKARLAAARAERIRLPHITLMLYDEDATPIYAPDVAHLMTIAPTDIAALLYEVERLRREADCWRDATHHLSGKRGEA